MQCLQAAFLWSLKILSLFNIFFLFNVKKGILEQLGVLNRNIIGNKIFYALERPT